MIVQKISFCYNSTDNITTIWLLSGGTQIENNSSIGRIHDLIEIAAGSIMIGVLSGGPQLDNSSSIGRIHDLIFLNMIRFLSGGPSLRAVHLFDEYTIGFAARPCMVGLPSGGPQVENEHTISLGLLRGLTKYSCRRVVHKTRAVHLLDEYTISLGLLRDRTW